MSSIYPSYGSAPTQLCQRCGRPLPPNEVYCSNCGLVNTPSQPNNALNGFSVPQQAFGPPNHYPAGNDTVFGSPSQQSNPTNFYGNGAPAPQQPFYPQPSPPLSASGFQTSGYAQPPAMNGYQQPQQSGFANTP